MSCLVASCIHWHFHRVNPCIAANARPAVAAAVAAVAAVVRCLSSAHFRLSPSRHQHEPCCLAPITPPLRLHYAPLRPSSPQFTAVRRILSPHPSPPVTIPYRTPARRLTTASAQPAPVEVESPTLANCQIPLCLRRDLHLGAHLPIVSFSSSSSSSSLHAASDSLDPTDAPAARSLRPPLSSHRFLCSLD
ncbi:predicted protein [Histoplasma capsulatum H143]|uniref:Uncharacterized protein n=1 Tax=Ajellomyces capsulatus (strain H143) TaxID=544712 RepID=C6H7S3_AJECH|nr:predicted protein [Histoplasma capsulatum H143]